MNREEVEEMFKVAEKEGCFLMEALWTRFLPAYIQVKKWVMDGKIGEIRRVTADFCWLADRIPDSRILDKEKGGGAVLDLGVYISGMACDIFDTPLLGLNSSVYYGPTGVDEAVSASLDFGKGRRGDIHASIISSGPEDAYIYGTEGSIKIPSFWKTTSAYLIKNGETVESVENTKFGNGYHYARSK